MDSIQKQLEDYKENAIYPEHIEEILDYMLTNIGCTNGYIRDELIYEAFCTMLDHNHISKEQIKRIAFTLIESPYLFYRMQEESDSAVIKRSFSVLFLAAILEWEQDKNLFSVDEYHKIVEAILKYFSEEKDYRGYVPKYGWLHAVAHGSDALTEIVKNGRTSEDTAKQILQLLNAKICQGDYVFTDREYFRMCRVLLAFLHNHCYNEQSITAFIQNLQNPYTDLAGIEYYHAKINIDQFLFQFYFELKKQEKYTHLLDIICQKINDNTL